MTTGVEIIEILCQTSKSRNEQKKNTKMKKWIKERKIKGKKRNTKTNGKEYKK